MSAHEEEEERDGEPHHDPHHHAPRQSVSSSLGTNRSPTKQAYLASLGCIVIVVASWVAMSELLKGLEEGYNKPYFLSYVIHSSYLLCLPLFWGVEKWRVHTLRSRAEGLLQFESRASLRQRLEQQNTMGAKARGYAVLGTAMGVMYTVVCYLWYLSLRETVPSANNAIFQSACVFVYIFSIPILKQPFSVQSLLAVLVAVGGVAMVGVFHDSGKGEEDTPFGYVLCLFATCGYGLYEVIVKKYGPASHSAAERLSDSILLFGLMGVAVLVLLWPLLFVLHFSGAETFRNPSPHQWTLILANVVLDSACNVFILFGITLTGPLFVSLGVMLVIPATLVTDVILSHISVPAMLIVGCLLIVVGFVVLHLPSRKGKAAPEQRVLVSAQPHYDAV